MFGEQKEDFNSVYYQLIMHVYDLDLINWPCFYGHSLPMTQLLEMFYRFSFYFKGEKNCELLQRVFMNQRAIDPAVQQNALDIVQASCQNIYRICTKSVKELANYP